MTDGEAGATTNGTGTIKGHATTLAAPVPDTQPAVGARRDELNGGTVGGAATQPGPRRAAQGTTTEEMLDQDWAHFGSAVRIPDNGAAVFAVSARALQSLAGPDTEIILFLRAKTAN